MKVVEVVPIARGIKKEKLHYFTSDSVKVGDFLEAPLRSRTIIVRVTAVLDAKDLKTEIKSSPFALKKASKIKTNVNLSPEFINSAIETAKFFLTSLGAVLQNILPPKDLFNDLITASPKTILQIQSNVRADSMVYQAPDVDRLSSYKSLIREKFAKNKSIFFVLPTTISAQIFFEKIKNGIEQYIFLLHSGLTKTEASKTWKKALGEKHPIIIVATSNFIFIPRSDFGAFIVEEEASRFYKKDQRPFIDSRFFIEKYVGQIGADLIFADAMVQSELIEKLNTHQCAEYTKPSFRLLFDNQAKVGLFPDKDKKPNQDPDFSRELMGLIDLNFKHDEKMFIFVPRKGLSPVTFCRDCSNVVRCPNCQSCLVLYEIGLKTKEKRTFNCHRCGFEKTAKSRCDICSSWNLQAIYSGIEGVLKNLQKKFPEIKFFGMSANFKKLDNRNSLKDFLSTPGSVLVGTEMVIKNLPARIHNVAVLSSESLFLVSEYSASESAVRLLLFLRSLAEKRFLIQNSELNNSFLSPILSGNLLDFYEAELKQRKILGYPPFVVIVSISVFLNTKSKKTLDLLKQDLESYKIFETEKKIGRRQRSSILFKVPISDYPNKKIQELVEKLSPDFEIEVNPSSLLI